MDEKQNKNTQPRKEGGQRISVRPGNFNPPSEAKSAAPADAGRNAANGGGGANKNGGNGGGHHRNRHGRGRRGHGADKQENANRQNQPQKDTRPQAGRAKDARTPKAPDAARPAGGKPQDAERRVGGEGGKQSRNRRNRRGGRGDRQRTEQVKETRDTSMLSPSLQRELDEEFGTPTFTASIGLGREKKRAEETVLDSEEFAVDIATASYLVEDVPCGFPAPDGTTVEVVGVRFRQAGRIYFFAPAGMKFRIGDRAIVDTARGPELGDIVMLNRKIAEKDVVQPLRSVLRRATPEDIAHEAENRAKEAEALKVCERKIAVHKLDMRLVDAQYTFDNSKLLFYFTSEGRVDFRELVHDLAGHFHTRIELRQIGIRDESRLIGGLGMCGRPFCCSTFLSDFGQVSVKMAKEQGLSINASKISGCCGRLMCCLRYEHETYVAEAKLTPKKDTNVITPDGQGTVVDSSPLAGTVRVRLNDTPEEAPKTYHRDTLTVLGKGEKQSAPDGDTAE